MKFVTYDYAVKSNGKYYKAGEQVPVVEPEKAPAVKKPKVKK